MTRKVKKQSWFSREEAADLRRKSRKCCLSEAALVRLLLRDFASHEQPDAKFYDAMGELSVFAQTVQEMAYFLTPQKSERPWQ